jgi:hypothetical protein
MYRKINPIFTVNSYICVLKKLCKVTDLKHSVFDIYQLFKPKRGNG